MNNTNDLLNNIELEQLLGDTLPKSTKYTTKKGSQVVLNKKVGRNQLCFCGSRRKAKKCCLKELNQ